MTSMKMRSIAAASLLAAGLAAQPASAAIVLPVETTYANGARFEGLVTFADDFSSILDVDGILYGYGYFGRTGSSYNYNPAASSVISWVWAGGADFAGGADVYGTYLMSGTNTANYGSFIQFGYDFSNAPALDFTTGGFPNSVNYTAAFTGGGLVGGVPEPATWLLFILGFAGIGIMLRREQRQQRVPASQIRLAYA
jgi:hypothetical protein